MTAGCSQIAQSRPLPADVNLRCGSHRTESFGLIRLSLVLACGEKMRDLFFALTRPNLTRPNLCGLFRRALRDSHQMFPLPTARSIRFV